MNDHVLGGNVVQEWRRLDAREVAGEALCGRFGSIDHGLRDDAGRAYAPPASFKGRSDRGAPAGMRERSLIACRVTKTSAGRQRGHYGLNRQQTFREPAQLLARQPLVDDT